MAQLVFLPLAGGSGNVGHVCVRDSFRSHSEPLEIVNYWDVLGNVVALREVEWQWPELVAGKAIELRQCDTAVYATMRGGFNSQTVRIFGGGSAKSIHQETHAVVCPKVRKGIATRYWRGQWEKYLKASGWVAA